MTPDPVVVEELIDCAYQGQPSGLNTHDVKLWRAGYDSCLEALNATLQPTLPLEP